MTWMWAKTSGSRFCRSDSDLDVGLDVWTVFCRSGSDLGGF